MKKTLEQLRQEAARQIDTSSDDNQAVAVRKGKFRDTWKDVREVPALARAMQKVRASKDDLEEKLKEVNAEYDVLRLELMPTLLEDQGLENVKMADFYGPGESARVQVAADLYVKVPKEYTESFHKWLKKNKLGALIQPTINSSTLKAFTKGRIEAGKKLPEGLKVTPFTRASIVKA